MSGICGVVNFQGAPVGEAALESMAAAVRHRGPDGMAFHRDGAVGIGHLSRHFTPESVHERQPLVCTVSEAVLTADARIDNREDLLRELGLRTASRPPASASSGPGAPLSDADVILAAYRRWGIDCARHLIGDFAFAIWDGARRQLFLARDPMAMRGLYYRVERDRVMFATEVKQILAVPGVPVRIFEPALGAWLCADSGPIEWTFYEGIEQLPPGHALLAGANGHRTWAFWQPDPEYRIRYRRDDEYAVHLRDLLETAVSCRLRSVKPIGISLSGGVDSGSVAAMAGWIRENRTDLEVPPLSAYCYAFERQPECDERHISDIVARRYDIAVRAVPADCAWPLKDYPAHGPDRDDPRVGPYQCLVDLALEMAREDGMGGMLVGTHGDHMMGGSIYGYVDLLLSGRWLKLGSRLLAHGGHQPRRMASATLRHLVRPLARAIRTSGRPAATAGYPDWIRMDFARRSGLGVARPGDAQYSRIRDEARLRRHEMIFSPLELNNTTSLERAYSRFGLERLDPWGDRRVAEFVLAVPQYAICRAGTGKWLAREAMRGVVPETARQAAGKTLPVGLYELATRRLERSTILSLLTNSHGAARGCFDDTGLRRHFETHAAADEADEFWPALGAEMWLRNYWA